MTVHCCSSRTTATSSSGSLPACCIWKTASLSTLSLLFGFPEIPRKGRKPENPTPAPAPKRKKPDVPTLDDVPRPPEKPKRTGGTKNLQKQLNTLEREISQLEQQSADLEQQMIEASSDSARLLELMTEKETCDESLAAKMDEWEAVAAELEEMPAMIERRFWLALAALFAVGGVVQLPWAPSRFGAAFFLVLAVGCAGMWLMLHGREKYGVCRVLAVLGRVLFALFVVSFAAIQLFVIQAGMRTQATDTQAEYYIVLGALVNPDGQPSAALAARCDTAAELLAENPDSKAVLCGGQGSNEPCTEADSMFAYLTEQKGVDPARLLREDASTNTIENLENARTLIENRRGARP